MVCLGDSLHATASHKPAGPTNAATPETQTRPVCIVVHIVPIQVVNVSAKFAGGAPCVRLQHAVASSCVLKQHAPLGIF